MAQGVTNRTSIHEDAGLIPGLALWVKDRHCPVAGGGRGSPNSNPNLKNSKCHRGGPEMKKKKKKKEKRTIIGKKPWVDFHWQYYQYWM